MTTDLQTAVEKLELSIVYIHTSTCDESSRIIGVNLLFKWVFTSPYRCEHRAKTFPLQLYGSISWLVAIGGNLVPKDAEWKADCIGESIICASSIIRKLFTQNMNGWLCIQILITVHAPLAKFLDLPLYSHYIYFNLIKRLIWPV